jgi:hypothetical protein
MTNRTTARRFIPASEMPDEGDRAYLARAGGVRVASPEDRAGQGERRRRLAPPRSSTHRGDRLAKARHRATSGRVDAWSCDAGGTRHLPAPQIRCRDPGCVRRLGGLDRSDAKPTLQTAIVLAVVRARRRHRGDLPQAGVGHFKGVCVGRSVRTAGRP